MYQRIREKLFYKIPSKRTHNHKSATKSMDNYGSNPRHHRRKTSTTNQPTAFEMHRLISALQPTQYITLSQELGTTKFPADEHNPQICHTKPIQLRAQSDSSSIEICELGHYLNRNWRTKPPNDRRVTSAGRRRSSCGRVALSIGAKLRIESSLDGGADHKY